MFPFITVKLVGLIAGINQLFSEFLLNSMISTLIDLLKIMLIE